MMKKELLLAVSVLGFTLGAQANEWEFLPVTGDNYQADFAVAVVGGRTDIDNGDTVDINDDVNGDASTVGIEASFNCPLLKPPHHTIRQQVSYVKTDEDGVETSSIELNPHHMFQINEKLQAGFGPSLGVTKVETNVGDDSVFTYGLGASVRYNFTESVFVGGEARYAWSKDVEIAGVDEDFDNFRMLVKVGYQF